MPIKNHFTHRCLETCSSLWFMRWSSRTKLCYRFRTKKKKGSPSFPSVGHRPSFLTPAVHCHITRLNGLGSACWEPVLHDWPCSHWPLEQIWGSWRAGFQVTGALGGSSQWLRMTICIVPSWTHCRLSKPKGSSCEWWSLVGSSTWRSQRYFWPGELQLMMLSLTSDSLEPFFISRDDFWESGL